MIARENFLLSFPVYKVPGKKLPKKNNLLRETGDLKIRSAYMKQKKEKEIAEHILLFREKYYKIAYSYVKNEQDALDILQESIYKAMKNAPKLKDDSAIKTWMYRIVYHTAMDFLRAKRRFAEQALEDVEEDIGGKSTEEFLDVKEAMEKLSIKEQTIVMLRYYEDLKLEEIADVLGENINTIKSRLYKTLKKLRIFLEDEEA